MTLSEKIRGAQTFGGEKMLYSLAMKGKVTVEDAAEELHISVQELERKISEAGYKIPVA